MKLIATKSQRYAQRNLEPGDRFEATDRDARILLALKRAERCEESAVVPSFVPPSNEILPGVVAPPLDPSAKPEKKSKAKKDAGEYKRRDMRAE